MLESKVAQMAFNNVWWKKSLWLPLCMCQFTYSFAYTVFTSLLKCFATQGHPYAILIYPVRFVACSCITVRQPELSPLRPNITSYRLCRVLPPPLDHHAASSLSRLIPTSSPTTSSPSPLTPRLAIYTQIFLFLPTYLTRCVSSTFNSQMPTCAFRCWL